MAYVDFSNIHESDQQDFSLPPVGEYPCELKLKAFKKDAQGNAVTGLDGNPLPLTTAAGDAMWNIEATIIDGPHAGKRPFLDNLSFGKRAAKRAALVLVRAGMMPSEEECKKNPQLYEERKREFLPEELDKTLWWVSIHHERAVKAGQPREGKYEFKAHGCTCEVCVAAAGKKLLVNCKVDFDGYRPMTVAEAKKYAGILVAKVGPPTPDQVADDNNKVPF